jgi:hypothetical protein
MTTAEFFDGAKAFRRWLQAHETGASRLVTLIEACAAGKRLR